MARKTDITGMKFANLTVLTPNGSKNGSLCWDCMCGCGQIVNVRGPDIRRGRTKSCGCLNAKMVSDRNKSQKRTHGHTSGGSPSRTYNSWHSMRSRCENPNNQNFKNYGGRGISVCQEWASFDAFLTDMGERPEGMTIDRIDVNGDYQKSNCKWSIWKDQCLNKRKKNEPA